MTRPYNLSNTVHPRVRTRRSIRRERRGSAGSTSRGAVMYRRPPGTPSDLGAPPPVPEPCATGCPERGSPPLDQPVEGAIPSRLIHGSPFDRGAVSPPGSLPGREVAGDRDNGARGGRPMRGKRFVAWGARCSSASGSLETRRTLSGRRGAAGQCGALTRWRPHPRIRLGISRRTSRP